MVYVDDAGLSFRRMKMCHMVADTEEELHAMKREWYQANATPHYDVSMTKRRLALQLGAVSVGRRELVQVIRRQRRENGIS